MTFACSIWLEGVDAHRFSHVNLVVCACSTLASASYIGYAILTRQTAFTLTRQIRTDRLTNRTIETDSELTIDESTIDALRLLRCNDVLLRRSQP